MADLLVFGASGRTGRHLCELAGPAGWQPVAAVRDPIAFARLGNGVRCVKADLLDPASVTEAMRSTAPQAVICVVGGRSDIRVDSDGVMAVTTACHERGIKRLIVVTSLGCGDSEHYASPALLRAIGPVLAAKTHAERHLTISGLDWTIVRPGGLLEQDASGTGALYADPRVHGRISCRDLATLLLALVNEPASIGKILSAVDTASVTGPASPHRFTFTGPREPALQQYVQQGA